jgi:hypothetical protein
MAGPTGPTTGRNSAAGRRNAPPPKPAAAPTPQVASTPDVSGPSVVVRMPAAAPAAPAAPAARENTAILYGLIVVVAGFVAILFGLWLVVINYKTASDATAILGIITTAIAGLGGAFFGVAIGQQGTSSANKERASAEVAKDEAQMRTIKFAANMDPAVARRLVE